MISGVAWLAILGGGCSSSRVTSEPVPPDILVVVLDTVRADRLSISPHTRHTTPHLARLSERGVVFEDAWASSSWTWPVHASLFTGEPPWRHGAHNIEAPHIPPIEVEGFRLGLMEPSLPTLAEQLGEGGYRSIMVSTNSLLSAELGLSRGFDHVVVEASDEESLKRVPELLAGSDEPVFLFVNLLTAHMPWHITPVAWSTQHAAALTPEGCPDWACPFLGDGGAELDLYKAHQGPSGVYWYMSGRLQIPPEGLQLMADLYDGHLAEVDYQLGQLLRIWGDRGGVVAVTSDHGEHLGERQRLDHGNSLYPELTRVPLVLVGPGVATGVRVPTGVSLEDLPATLLGLAGMPVPGGAWTLLDAIGGKARPGPITAALWRDEGAAGILDGPFDHGWRLYREADMALLASTEPGGEAWTDHAELYDLSVDPWMRRDIAAEQPEELARLRAASRAAIPLSPPSRQAATELSADLAERLAELGYIQPAQEEVGPERAP